MKPQNRDKSIIFRFPLLFFVLFLSLINLPAFGQPPVSQDPDGWFFRARDLAQEGKYEEARQICTEILKQFPNYNDVKILKARTFSWEGQFVRANDLLREVLQAEPGNKDALFAIIDLLMWYEDYAEAIKFLDMALYADPHNTHLLYRKAVALKETGDDLAAVVLLNQILGLDPTYTDAKDLLATIEVNRLVNHIGLGYRGLYFFQSPLNNKPWHLFYAEYGRRTRRLGPLAIRANYAWRADLDVTSLQIEADAYPTVRQGTYLYLNFGYSQDRKLFPITRFGFEVYQALPRSWEISAGFRLLNFDETETRIVTKDILILTGSISKYIKKYYFSFRPYFTFSSVAADAATQSYFFTARRFFKTTENYLSLTVGRGFSADYDRLSGGQVYDLSGTLLEGMLHYQHRISTRFLGRVGAGYKWYNDNVLYGNPVVFEGALIYRF